VSACRNGEDGDEGERSQRGDLEGVGGPGQRDRATAVDEVGCAARKPGCGIGPYRRIASLDGGRFRAMPVQEKG